MTPVPENIRLVKRAYWLIKLRWIAIVSVGAATYVSNNLLDIELQDVALYGIAMLLAVYNVTVLLLLNHFVKGREDVSHAAVKRIINVQISADLLILTILLHFSGGIENPFIFYFVFHMIIASILLSTRESYLHATLAVLLFGLLILLEYLELVPHYCLNRGNRGFVSHCLHKDGLYILGTFFAFTTVLYLAVYMASYISVRLKRAEYAYRQANILLQEKDHIKNEYVVRVTHDIKAHLATIKGCLSVIVNKVVGPLDGEPAEFVDRAHARTIKLTNFVEALLKLTHMRLSDKFEMDVFSLRDTIDNAVAAVRTKAEDKSITLNRNIESSVDEIFGNRLSIEEVVSNLVFNSMKYTPVNGTIEINARHDGDCVLVEVADTGIGIPQEELPKVFDEFYRATNARRLERDGSGLGLSIVKHIVERHNGRIWVDSQEGVGTKFSFTLPKNTTCGRMSLK